MVSVVLNWTWRYRCELKIFNISRDVFYIHINMHVHMQFFYLCLLRNPRVVPLEK